MSTVNGFGILYYGWKARPDGTAEATRWIVAAFFPVIPSSRHRIRVLDTRDEQASFLLFGGSGFGTQLQLVERLPLNWAAILATYAKAYLVLPFILAFPMAAMIGVLLLLERLGYPQAGRSVAVIATGTVACFIYWGVVVAYILDGASGRRVQRSVARLPKRRGHDASADS
jgi:hypothetical protein